MYKVEKLALGGDGIALDGGKRIFIPLSAPGDVVEARVTEDHGSWGRAEIIEMLEASPGRVEPRCKYYGVCGGCSLQHLSYEAQIDAKKNILKEALNRPGKPGAQSLPGKRDAPEKAAELPPIRVIPSAPFEYRNRVSLHAIRSNRFPRCGFKERKGDTVIPLDDCPVLVPELRRVLPRLMPPPGKDRFTLYGKGETLIAETGACIAENGTTAAEPLPSRGTISLATAALGAMSTGPERGISLEAGSFFQSNAGALASLIGELRAAAESAAATTATAATAGEAASAEAAAMATARAATLADLYAGVGTFSLFLYDLFPGGIDLLEANAAALNLAKQNLSAARGALTAGVNTGGCRFFPQKDEQWAKKRNLGGYSFVVADPPREGLSPALREALCRSGPPVFAYISCEPSTFARDFHILSKYYKAEALFLFDFYPQTAHIETMGIFSRE